MDVDIQENVGEKREERSPYELDKINSVLSIQSHTVHGYVGNRCAVFTLQLRGFEVDFINSVQFSNHTGYKTFKGQVLEGAELSDLLLGLEANGLLCYNYLLTGYIRSVEFLHAIVEVHSRLKAANPDLRYVCDPVLGDDDKLYVPQEMVEIYKSDLIPLSNIITPNHFEAEVLTGISVRNQAQAVQACKLLHEMGPKVVVITSIPIPDNDLLVVLSEIKDDKQSIYTLTCPKVSGRYHGTGDLMAALLLANIHEEPMNAGAALEKTVSTMYAVMQRSAAGPIPTDVATFKELKLIQSKNDIECPNIVFQVTEMCL